MKTLKALKITSILSVLHCLWSIIFVACLIISWHFNSDIITNIGVISIFGWMINPLPVISASISLTLYWDERHSPEAKQLIGKKYIWIFIWPLITSIFYFIAMGFFLYAARGV